MLTGSRNLQGQNGVADKKEEISCNKHYQTIFING